MTAADHANTVREALEWAKADRAAFAALDALQAQAEAVEKRRIVTTTVQGDTHMNRLRERAEAAEAERDEAGRVAAMLRHTENARIRQLEAALLVAQAEVRDTGTCIDCGKTVVIDAALATDRAKEQA